VKRSEARWAIVVPIKRLAVAKTRLADVDAVRADLAPRSLDRVGRSQFDPEVLIAGRRHGVAAFADVDVGRSADGQRHAVVEP